MANVRRVRLAGRETPKKRGKGAKRAKQQTIPGMEDRKLEELHSAADAFLDAKEEAKVASDAKKAAETMLVNTMKKLGKNSYSFDGLSITLKSKDDSVTVKSLERKSDTEETETVEG